MNRFRLRYQGEICERQAHKLVNKFDMEEDLPPEGVIGMPDLLEMH